MAPKQRVKNALLSEAVRQLGIPFSFPLQAGRTRVAFNDLYMHPFPS
jgi:hypothetical protein